MTAVESVPSPLTGEGRERVEETNLRLGAVQYVCGFLFSQDLTQVVLIRKLRPQWQRGKLNGIGGSIEPGETWFDAMVREFREETGAAISGWQLFHVERFPAGAVVHYGCAIGEPMRTRAMTDEPVVVTDVRAGITPFTAMFNLPYLIPMAQIFLCQPEELRPVIAA